MNVKSLFLTTEKLTGPFNTNGINADHEYQQCSGQYVLRFCMI